MKRFIGSILTVIFMFTILSACGSDPQTLLDFFPSNDNDLNYDFGGAKITCTGGWSLFDTKNESELNTIQSDRRLYQTAQVEKDLNVDLVQDWNATSESSAFYFSLYAANNLKYDLSIQQGSPNPVYDMYKSGMLEPLENMSAIDLSDVEYYGTPESRRGVTFGGLTYAYTGGGEGGTDRGYLAYNDYLVKSFGAADPQELYEQGKWTFDTFAEMVPLVSDLSDPTNKIYGLTLYCDSQMLPFCAVFANGGQVIKQNENGRYVFALEDKEAMEALEWVTDLQSTGAVKLESWEPSLFQKGQATFYLGRSWSVQKALNEESSVDEFYYIPFPYGPSGEYGVSSASYASESGGIVFFNSSDTDMVGKVFDYWKRFDNYPEELYYDEDEYSISNNFWSQESYEHFQKAEKVFEYDYYSQIGSDLYGKLAQALHNATVGNTTFSNVFASYRATVQAAIDDSLNNN